MRWCIKTGYVKKIVHNSGTEHHKAREKLPKKEEGPHKFKVNDMVLVKDPDAAVFELRYQPNFRVTAILATTE